MRVTFPAQTHGMRGYLPDREVSPPASPQAASSNPASVNAVRNAREA